MAGRKYDIAQKIAAGNQKPTIVIDENHEFQVNNSKSAALMAQAMVEEKGDSTEALDGVIKLALGAEAYDYIESLELSLPAYNAIVNAIMAAFADMSLEEMEETAQEKKGKK